jgi:predicted PurR-regulated permease PerM
MATTSSSPAPWASGLTHLAALVIVLAAMRVAAPIVVPFLLVLFIAILCDPVVRYLVRLGLSRGVSVAMVLVVVVVLGLVLVAAVGSAYQRFSSGLPLYQQRIAELTERAASGLSGLGIDVGDRPILNALDPSIVMVFARDVLLSLGGVLTDSVLILLAVIFLLLEVPALSARLASRPAAGRGHVDLSSLFAGINRYMATKGMLSLLAAVCDAIGLWLLGVDFPVIWGLLAFLLNFIPNIGAIIATVPPVLLALVLRGPGSALAVLVLFLGVGMLVGNVLEPRLLGRRLGLSPFVVLVSLVFWGWLLGPVGMVLAVPLTMAVRLALEAREGSRWMGLLLSGEHAGGAAARE